MVGCYRGAVTVHGEVGPMIVDLSSISSILFFVFQRPSIHYSRCAYTRDNHPSPRGCSPCVQLYARSLVNCGVYLPALGSRALLAGLHCYGVQCVALTESTDLGYILNELIFRRYTEFVYASAVD